MEYILPYKKKKRKRKGKTRLVAVAQGETVPGLNPILKTMFGRGFKSDGKWIGKRMLENIFGSW